jgi:HD-GYP domain-containing protein (c-di-GMP phosphodiesterase class II)
MTAKHLARQATYQRVDLNLLEMPLRMIVGLSCLAFVICLCFEIFSLFGLQASHLYLTIAAPLVLLFWALIERQILTATQKTVPTTKVLLGLLIFLLLVASRVVVFFLSDSLMKPSRDLALDSIFSVRWIFLLGYTLVFIYISQAVIELFLLSEKNRANTREEQLLSSLNALAMARDNETGNHILRTQHYVKVLALRLRAMNQYTAELSDADIELLFNAAPLHDLGKIGIPDAILLKPGSLTEDEWTVMKTHTTIGEQVLSAADAKHEIKNDVIEKAIMIAGGHHEKWNGKGYPRGLVGEQIPLPARIMSLADMYDALVSERIYKKGWSHDEAVLEILSKREIQFDPVVVDAFLLEAENFKAIAHRYQD